ncbi:MAG: NAD-dependent epimerase/dehydratase family protein [Bacteroidota bacterium]
MILVTGANGLVGSFTCKALKEAKIPFRGLVRENSDLSLLREMADYIIYGDFLNLDFLDQLIPDFNIVIHCAAVVSFAKTRDEEMYNVNVVGTKQLVDAALNNNIDYFLHVSSVAAIGRNDQGNLVDERNHWITSKSNTGYGESKYFSELEVWRGMQEGLKAAIINPSVILAPGDWNKGSTKLFKYVWDENKYYGGGKLNYVDIRDVVAAIMLLTDRKITNERFILSAGATSFKLFFETIAKVFEKRAPYIQVTKSLSSLATIFFRIKSLITNSEPLVTRESFRVSNSHTVFNSQKVKDMLNFEFSSLENTVMWTAAELLKKNS